MLKKSTATDNDNSSKKEKEPTLSTNKRKVASEVRVAAPASQLDKDRKEAAALFQPPLGTLDSHKRYKKSETAANHNNGVQNSSSMFGRIKGLMPTSDSHFLLQLLTDLKDYKSIGGGEISLLIFRISKLNNPPPKELCEFAVKELIQLMGKKIEFQPAHDRNIFSGLAIGNTLYGLGKLAEKGCLNQDVEIALEVDTLIYYLSLDNIQSSSASDESRNVSNAFYGLGKLAESGKLKFDAKHFWDNVLSIFIKFAKIKQENLSIALVLQGLGKIIEKGRWKINDNNIVNLIEGLVKDFSEQSVNGREITILLGGLVDLAENGFSVNSEIMSSSVLKITEKFLNPLPNSPAGIAIFLSLLGVLVRLGLPFEHAKYIHHIKILLEHYNHQSSSYLFDYYMVFSGLALIVHGGLEVKTINDSLITIFNMFARIDNTSDPAAQAASLFALGTLLKNGLKIEQETVLQLLTRNIKQLDAALYNLQSNFMIKHVAMYFQGLGMIAISFNLNFQNLGLARSLKLNFDNLRLTDAISRLLNKALEFQTTSRRELEYSICGLAILLEYSVLSIDVQCLENYTYYCSKNILDPSFSRVAFNLSNVLYGAGKIAEFGKLKEMKADFRQNILNIWIAMMDDAQMSPRSASQSIYALGKLSEYLKLEYDNKDFGQYLIKLFDLILSKNPSIRDISLSIFGFGKILIHTCLDIDNQCLLDILNRSIALYLKENDDNEQRSVPMLIFGIGEIAKYTNKHSGYPLKNIELNGLIMYLFEMISKNANPILAKAKEENSISVKTIFQLIKGFWRIIKFSRVVLDEKILNECLKLLLKQLSLKNVEVFEMSAIVYLVGKIAETNILDDTFELNNDLLTIANKLIAPSLNINSLDIAQMLFGLGKIVVFNKEVGDSKIFNEIFSVSMHKLSTIPSTVQRIGMSFYGLGKTLEKHLVTDLKINTEILGRLLHNFTKLSAANSKDKYIDSISMSIMGMGMIAEHTKVSLNNTGLINLVFKIIADYKQPIPPGFIAIILSSLGKILKKVDSSVIPKDKNNLLRDLLLTLVMKLKKNQGQFNIYHNIIALEGISNLFQKKVALELVKEPEIKQAVLFLLNRLVPKRISLHSAVRLAIMICEFDLVDAELIPAKDFLRFMRVLLLEIVFLIPNLESLNRVMTALSLLKANHVIFSDSSFQPILHTLNQIYKKYHAATTMPNFLQKFATSELVDKKENLDVDAGAVLSACNRAVTDNVPTRDVELFVLQDTKEMREGSVFYNLKQQSDISRLTSLLAQQKIKFESEKTALVIAPVTAIQGALGVFAGDNLQQSNRAFGKYLGDYLPDDGRDNSAYAFATALGNIIDAQNKRNWTAFVNHSETPNVSVVCRKYRGQENIYFYINKAIQAGKQLFIDYGPNFFANLDQPIVPAYLHEDDNWKTPKTNFLDNLVHYEKKVIKLNPDLTEAVACHPSQLFVLTNLTKAVFADTVSFKVLLSKYTQFPKLIDLPSYSIEKIDGKQCYQFAEMNKQEHFTPLMLACYIGDVEKIKLLIDMGADINRKSMQTGNFPLHYLLMNKLANEDDLLPIVSLFIEKQCYLSLRNRQKFTNPGLLYSKELLKDCIHYILKNRSYIEDRISRQSLRE